MDQKKIIATLNEYQMRDKARLGCHGVHVDANGWAQSTDGNRAFKTLGLATADRAAGVAHDFDSKGFRGVKDVSVCGPFPDTTELWQLDKHAKARRFELTRLALPKTVKDVDQPCSVLADGTLVLGEHKRSVVVLSLKYLLDVPDDCVMVVRDSMSPVHFIGPDWQVLIMPMRKTREAGGALKLLDDTASEDEGEEAVTS